VEFERITIGPAKMRGVPCIRGLRIPVATVLGQLAAGRTVDQILADFPELEAEDISAHMLIDNLPTMAPDLDIGAIITFARGRLRSRRLPVT
jgi:uncharacterized protein (DUF433 family)